MTNKMKVFIENLTLREYELFRKRVMDRCCITRNTFDCMMSEEYNRISMQCNSGYNSGMREMFNNLYGK